MKKVFFGAAVAGLLLVASSAVAADWSFNSERGWAVTSAGGARLLVTCVDSGKLGIVYELQTLDDAVIAVGDAAEFMFSLDHVEWSRAENGFGGGGDRPYYLAMTGEVAADWISATARAPSTVFVGVGVPNSEGAQIYNVTEFSASGSSAAVSAVRAAC